MPLADLLVRVGLAESKREARELDAGGAIQLNGAAVTAPPGAVLSSEALRSPDAISVSGRARRVYRVVIVADGDEKNPSKA